MTQTVTLFGKVDMPLVGFGTWQLRGRSATQAVCDALEVGYRHLDTATMYRNEAEVGSAVRDSGLAREDLFITTKVGPSLAGQERQTLQESLRALGTGYVDLWLIHWPPQGGGASLRMWQELVKARDAGLVRAIGVSNYSVGQLDDLRRDTGEVPAVNQVPWSPFEHDPAVLAAHRERGVVLEGYSPLKRSKLGDRVLAGIAERHGVTVPQVVLRWHVEHGVPTIPKSARRERMAVNFDIFGFALTAEEVASIDALAG